VTFVSIAKGKKGHIGHLVASETILVDQNRPKGYS